MILYIETYKLEPNTNQTQTEPKANPNRTQSRKIDIKFIQVL